MNTKEDILRQRLIVRNNSCNEQIQIVSGQQYINNKHQMLFKCEHGHQWKTTADTAITQKRGCPLCKKEQTRVKQKEIFTQKANMVHKNRYNYSTIVYVNGLTKIRIGCLKHGAFQQIPRFHLNGQGCPKCAIDNIPRVLHTTFIKKAKKVHNNKYDYSLINNNNYFNIRSKLPIICPRHGVFHQRGDDHNRGHGCPKCGTISCSHKALAWLDYIMITEHVNIQHAGNGGEYRIPNTCMSADGYCSETNTIYEFDGDVFHGNPNIYGPTDKCHPFNKTTTAEQLYNDTLTKHNRLRNMGFTLVTIWESDFNLMNIPITSKYNNIIVSKVDNTYPDQLKEIGLEIVGEYTGAKSKYTLRCLLCGGTHVSTPVSKLWSKKRHPDIYGCPTCNLKITGRKNKARGNYEGRLAALNYIVVDYVNAGIKCWLQCTKCGKRKFVTPSAIIQRNRPCCGDR